MNIRSLLLALTAITATFSATANAESAAESAPNSTKPATMKYWRIYTDAKGESHAKEERLTFEPLFSKGPDGLVIASAPGATFFRASAGTLEDFHVAPQRLYLIGIQGSSEVTLSDGAKLQMKPGTVMLLEDTTGKGHAVKVLGKQDHVVMAVPIVAPVVESR